MGNKKISSRDGFLKIIAVCLLLLGLIGVSYASFNDTLTIRTLLKTASMDLSYCANDYTFEQEQNGNLEVDFNNNVLTLTGEVQPEYSAQLNYCVKNDSSILIKFIEQQGTVPEGLNVSFNQYAGLIEPGARIYNENPNDLPYIQIEAIKEGTYSFEIVLLYCLYNGNENSWAEKLIVRVDNIKVIEEDSTP